MDACWCDDWTLSVCNDDCDMIRELPLLRERVERAEAAARDFAGLLHAEIMATQGDYDVEPESLRDMREALTRHPSFLGEEGIEG